MIWLMDWTLLSTLAGGLLALAGSWLTQRFAAKREDKNWLRDQKVKHYTEFVQRFESGIYWTPPKNAEPDAESFHEDLDRQLAPLKVLGAGAVINKIEECAKEEFARALCKVDGDPYPDAKEYKRRMSEMVEAMNHDLYSNKKKTKRKKQN